MLLRNKIDDAFINSEQVTLTLKSLFGQIENKYGFDLVQKVNVSEVSIWVADNLKGFVGGTFNIFIALGIMYFIL